MKVLLRVGAPPNVRDHDGRSVLQQAARRDAEFVSVLLEGGALPHLADNQGRTPLHDAVEAGLVEAVRVLLAAGARPQAVDAKGVTAMDLARQLGNDEVLALLDDPPEPPPSCGILCDRAFWRWATARYVKEVYAGNRSPQGDSALHFALAAGATPEIVEILLDQGADPNARNAHDDTPLHVAARTPGAAVAIPVLLERGAILEAANAEDWTPLHVASERPFTIDAMRVLLSAGAHPNLLTGDFHKDTAWNIAARQREGPEALKLLLEHGDSKGVEPQTGLMGLIHSAAARGHPETVTLLLDRGIHPGHTDAAGNTALFHAVRAGNLATLRVLLAADAGEK